MTDTPVKEQRPTPLGELLTYYRKERDMSVHAFAKQCGLSHPYVASVERGEVIPSRESLERIAENLGLPPNKTEALIQAAARADPLVAPGFVVNIQTLIDRQMTKDVVEVWVAVRRMVELEDPELATQVFKKLKEGCPYVYFVDSRETWAKLQRKLFQAVGKNAASQLVTCLMVPEFIQAIFFHPGFALYVREGHPFLVGIVPFEGPFTTRIEQGSMMNEQAGYDLYHALRKVVRKARSGEPAVLLEEDEDAQEEQRGKGKGTRKNRIEFVVLHAPTLDKGKKKT